jgi:hypothetical protein
LQFLIKNDIIYTSKLTKERRWFMNIEKLLKEISLGQNKIYKFYPQSTSWRFLIQKNKLKTEKGTFFYFFVVAFSLQLHKTKEVKCKTIKELRVFIKEMLRKGEQAGAD